MFRADPPPADSPPRCPLHEGWVIANHILVSFHVAFISSVLALPSSGALKADILRFIFLSPETLISALFMYCSFHTGVALHEIGHFLKAARLNALNPAVLDEVSRQLAKPFLPRLLYYAGVFALAPYGRCDGIKKEGLNYYPDAPYNLAVAAAGPQASRNAAWAALLPALLLIAGGLFSGATVMIHAGRLLLGIGVVTLLDFLLADPGKYAAFRERERSAQQAARAVAKVSDWHTTAAQIKQRMLQGRMQQANHPSLGPVAAPWQFRNCGMGGRHTEKDYPESNVSMQEAMFLILGAPDYQEAQEMTVRLQNRLKEIIEKEEGCRVMGIGLEGGLAPYIERGSYPLPEVRLWTMMKQAIEECGYRPGIDVAVALDPAMSELENAYRSEFNMPDSVGMYLFWRDKARTVLDRDGVLEIYTQAIQKYEIPILSIEDGFAEDDPEGWKKLLHALGDRIFVIGDDLVTTNDRTIEIAAGQGLINTALIKANQIGSLYETLLAMLVALGKNLELVVSHRSKSPNDTMEAHIALAANALGLKAGGGANTERLVKYQAVPVLIDKLAEIKSPPVVADDQKAVIRKISAYEEPTNAGIPTVGVEVELHLPDSGVHLTFNGATPLGTSAGTGEAVHLVDSLVEYAEHTEVIQRCSPFFQQVEPGVYAFRKEVPASRIRAGDEALTALFTRAQRYQGKGCLNAVDNVRQTIAPYFEGRNVATQTLGSIDRALLQLELHLARRRGKFGPQASEEDGVRLMQRKQNLGMNAMLSVSLALARAVAHVQRKQLYEILREEMLSIIDRLAATYRVPIAGSRFSDYVSALRQVNQILESEGKPLYQVLRSMTSIYTGEKSLSLAVAAPAETQPAVPPAAQAAEKTGSVRTPGQTGALGLSGDLSPRLPSGRTADARPLTPLPGVWQEAVGAVPEALFTREEEEQIAALDLAFYRVYVSGTASNKTEALQRYLTTKTRMAAKARRFGIINNRIFRGQDFLVAPYLAGETLRVHAVRSGVLQNVIVRRFPPGKIYTDREIAAVCGLSGEALDLEKELFELSDEQAVPIQIARIRDMASLLERINACVNRNEVVYGLRCLAARLCSLPFEAFLEARNLQPEVSNLIAQLVRLLNGPFLRRHRLLTRILVRNLSGIILRPKVIDELWNDTIDLAEIHIRGSSIVNELRRSAHHALGKRTLTLARAYLDYLQTGNTEGIARLGFDTPSPADVQARGRKTPRRIVERVELGLEKLLGISEVVTRIQEWRAAYAESLLRCEFGSSLQDELEALVSEGIRARNRWIYYQHLRILMKKAGDFSRPSDGGAQFTRRLESLAALAPDQDGFNPKGVEQDARDSVENFIREIQKAHQEELFRGLEAALAAYEAGQFFETFSNICRLRQVVYDAIRRGGFTEQRYYLYQLDCLLEEIGFLALRHVATAYDDQGVQLGQCLDIIGRCILNLDCDGLFSRELSDFAAMLTDSGKTYAEVMNVLEGISRNYHKILQRATIAYEKTSQRLGLEPAELRTALANMTRYMHDLNTMVHFSDLARTHIQNHVPDRSCPIGVPPPAADVYDIVHLSHAAAIRERVESAGSASNLRDQFGGKGSGLIYISYLNIPTCDGFILPTALSRAGRHQTDPQHLENEIAAHLRILEEDLSRSSGVAMRFGDPEHPLLLAVRGSSVFSLPGILSTVVFTGINDRIVETLARDDPWYAYDAYRRFLTTYSAAAWGVDVEAFHLVEETKRRYKVQYKYDLPWEAMKEIAETTQTFIRKQGYGEPLDQILSDPMRQLWGAVQAVFNSWNTERARRYRVIKGISDSWHTAAVVQVMASGNRKNESVGAGMDETQASLTGVIPRTYMTDRGIRTFEGEIKFSAVGDDLVGGLTVSTSFHPVGALGSLMPMLERRLTHTVAKLRRFMGTDQEIEFTVERGTLSVLQSRTAETSIFQDASAFVASSKPAGRGIGIRGGGFRGLVAFDEADRKELAAVDLNGRNDVDGVLLVVENPTPDDIPMIISADGLLTARGGSTSHAAVAINGIENKRFYAVMSVLGLQVDSKKHEAVILDAGGAVRHHIQKGDILSIHGTSGEVYIGSQPLHRRAR
ncbi:MAG: hypothetical protein HY315_02350 [Acidobacteria bacterium]|nr:hypothetical protein [Acidobacteriota bacterium]